MNLRVDGCQIEAFLDFGDTLAVSLDAVEERLDVRVEGNDFVAEERQDPSGLEGVRPQTDGHRLSQKLVAKSESICFC